MGLRELFKLMLDYFSRERMEYAVIGAFSLQAFGYVRATRDIDFLTRSGYQQKIETYLLSLGFDTIQKTTAFSNHVHPLGDARIDFMYVDGVTADTLLSSAVKMVVLGSNTVPVVSPEHLIALKLFAAHNEARRKYREFSDIQELVRRVPVKPDEVKKYFDKYDFTDLFEELFEHYEE